MGVMRRVRSLWLTPLPNLPLKGGGERNSGAYVDQLAHAGRRSGLLFALFGGGGKKIGERFSLFVSGLEHGHLHRGLNLRLGGVDGGCGEGGHERSGGRWEATEFRAGALMRG